MEITGEPFDPWQEWTVKHALELMPDGSFRFRIVLIVVARQNGKALDISTELPTSRGFVAMADIREGDEVYHPDGHLTRVIAVSDVMQDRDCYRVTTTDGRSVIADRDHLWTVIDKRRAKSKGPRGAVVRTYEPVVMTTGEMASAGTSRCKTGSRTSTTAGKTYATNEYRFTLPAQQPLESPDIPLPIAPYTLGAWLGDGHSASTSITCFDGEILDAIRADGYAIIPRTKHGAYQISNEPERARRLEEGRKLVLGIGVERAAAHVGVGKDALLGVPGVPLGRRSLLPAPEVPMGRYKTVQEILRDMGVLGSKHVPDAYLTAGASQREALLQGLLDTDGTIDPVRGQIEFCSTSRPLADAVLYLARSLGWRATLREGRATLYGKDCGPKYRVFFTPKTTDPFCPFRLPRKIARIRDLDGGKGRMTVSIASIEPVESRPVRCIQVESPDGLFLAGRDLIPTHNSHLKRGVSLWRMYMHPRSRIQGVAQEVTLAREQWNMCQDLIHASPDLDAEWGDVRNVNGDEYFWLANGSRYKIGAANRKAGRGQSNDEVNIDELREQRDWRAWAALSKTTMARENSQIWCMSNAGDDESVVLNQLLDVARAGTDPTIFLAEYAAPDDCELDDWDAIRHANPNLGRRISADAIRTSLTTDPPEVFRTEVLCQRVRKIRSAIDGSRWAACADPAGTFDMRRGKVHACIDVAPDGGHVTLAVGQLTADQRVRVAIAGAWDSTEAARAELEKLLNKIRPRSTAWYPSGPAAALATILRKRQGAVELTGGAVSEVCQELADIIKAARIVHPGDALLDDHILEAEKLKTGDGWRFARSGGHVDGAYACAGVVRQVLTQPITVPGVRMIAG